jgi:OmpA-OmpF porin, OOP family
MKKTPLTLLVLIVFLVIATMASAEGIRPNSFTISPVVGGYSYDGVQHLETRPVYGIRGGYDFTKWFGVEGVFDYVQSVGTQPGLGDIHTFRYGADALLYLLQDSRVVPYLAAGYSAITIDYEQGTPRGAAHFHHTRGIGDYGAGVKFFLTDNLAVRGDVRHLLFEDNQLLSNYEYTVGATFLFGGVKPAPAPVTEAPPVQETAPAPEVIPAPVLEAPPEPVPAAEPAPGHYKNCVTLHIDFDIDKADIKPEYHDEVAKVGDFMKQYPETTAVIEGHTDNIGTPEHNMKLSLLRAESVVKYLGEHFGIESSRFTAKGYGSTRPIADNATDAGKQQNRRIEAIIDCVNLPSKVTPPERLCMLLQLEFDTGKADIKPHYRDEIAKVGEYMKKYPTTTAVIEGHTDNVGGFDFNMKLSRLRAENVVNYLVENFGIEKSRLSAKGYGYTRRIAYNSTAEGRKKNRRINAVIDCVVK